MPSIVIHRHKDCERCAKITRIHKLFDWFNRLAVTTDDPKAGPLRPGEIAVEDLRTGRELRGIEAVRLIFRQIPAYLPLRPLLRLPPVARKMDAMARGCADGSCAVTPVASARR